MTMDMTSYLALRERPAGRAIMHQRWEHLLFLHWIFPPDVIQAALPRGLRVDTFDGSAWVGVVPFYMRNIRPWWSPIIPGISHFLELNLRTYVFDRHGIPGVWFFTLDCNQPLAVWWARTFFKLPYYGSRMQAQRDASSGGIYYESCRHKSPTQWHCRYQYEPFGPTRVAEPGSLEFFLVERYILFARRGEGQLSFGQVHHSPYTLRDVKVKKYDDHLLKLHGFAPTSEMQHAIYAPGVSVEVFPLKPIN